MKPLDEAARETLRAGKLAEGASLADRERVRRKLELALVAGLPGPAIPAPPTGAAKALAWKTALSVVVAVAGVGVSVAFWQPAKVEVTVAPVVEVEVEAPQPEEEVVVAPAEATPPVRRPKSRPVVPRVVAGPAPVVVAAPVPLPLPAPVPVAVAREEDTLEAETQGLREVQSALRDKDPTRALRLVTEQDRRFPRGQLGPEREAARVLATCASDPAAGPGAFASFVTAHPASPLLARLRAACIR